MAPYSFEEKSIIQFAEYKISKKPQVLVSNIMYLTNSKYLIKLCAILMSQLKKVVLFPKKSYILINL